MNSISMRSIESSTTKATPVTADAAGQDGQHEEIRGWVSLWLTLPAFVFWLVTGASAALGETANVSSMLSIPRIVGPLVGVGSLIILPAFSVLLGAKVMRVQPLQASIGLCIGVVALLLNFVR